MRILRLGALALLWALGVSCGPSFGGRNECGAGCPAERPQCYDNIWGDHLCGCNGPTCPGGICRDNKCVACTADSECAGLQCGTEGAPSCSAGKCSCRPCEMSCPAGYAIPIGTCDCVPCDTCEAGMARFSIKVTFLGCGCMDVYEASRPDATSTSPGTNASAATSRPGVLPWVASYDEAKAACLGAGKRLCLVDVWDDACGGPAGIGNAATGGYLPYPYGNTYDPTACNGADRGVGKALPTGSLASCVSPSGIFDLSGNLREWVDRAEAAAAPAYTGGSFLSAAGKIGNDELGCRFIGGAPAPEAAPDTGFRCCK